MSEREQKVRRILEDEYGITTMEELDMAIANTPPLNISIFVTAFDKVTGEPYRCY